VYKPKDNEVLPFKGQGCNIQCPSWAQGYISRTFLTTLVDFEPLAIILSNDLRYPLAQEAFLST
jgi:hypothetical protein